MVRTFAPASLAAAMGNTPLVAARRLALGMGGGTNVVILPDRGDRYPCTNLFRSRCADYPP